MQTIRDENTTPAPPLVPGGFDLEITPDERAAIGNDGTCDSLLRYFRSRSWDVGGFVHAVLSNDLLRALNNRGVSWEAVDTIRLILNRCPPGAFGSYQLFEQWTGGRRSRA